MKCAQHAGTDSASRVKEKLRVLWDMVDQDWNKRNIPGCAGRDMELGTASFRLSWEPCRQRGEERCGFTSLSLV